MNLSRDAKKLMLISATIIVSSVFLLGTNALNSINAQTTEKITINVDSSDYAPLTLDPNANQLKVIVGYETKDPQLVNTKINGVMKVTAENGTLVKTSSFPNGFDLTDSGRIQFASSFSDDSLTKVKADIQLTDLNKTTVLSNAVTTEVSLNRTSDSDASSPPASQ
jgi:hypothetical protein